MRINREEVEKTAGIKAWLSGMQTICKGPDGPVFKIMGPMVFSVRARKAVRGKGGTTTNTQNWHFMGDEAFRLSGVFWERVHTTDQIEIGVTLVPADLKLAGEVASATMTLAEAIEKFEGIEAWMDGVADRPVVPTKHPELAPMRETAPAHDEDDRWGSW